MDDNSVDDNGVDRLPPEQGPTGGARGIRTFDYALAMASVAVLAAIGALTLYAAGWHWWLTRIDPAWTEGPLYVTFTGAMDQVTTPFFIALFVLLTLCIPRRLVSRKALVLATAAIAAVSLTVGLVYGSQGGLAFMLGGAALIQAAVIVMTIAGMGVIFMVETRVARAGSALLHLGLVAFFFVVVILEPEQTAHAIVYWSSVVSTVAGTVMVFYGRSLIRLVRMFRPA